jgi:hypothetical protein
MGELQQTIRPDIRTQDIPGYWDGIKDHERWGVVADWIRFFSPMDLLVDVGCYDTAIILEGEAKERICIDLLKFPDGFTGTKIHEEWLKVELPRTADLILCLEVVEHQTDDEVLEFTDKLFRSAHLVLVSMPLNWREGKCENHFQDPIDDKKFDYLMHHRHPLKVQDVVHKRPKDRGEEVQRVALYAGDCR